MKNQFVTEKYLDKKLDDYSQIIIAAVDGVLDKRLQRTEENLKKDINNVQILIDGYVKAQEDFKQEFVIMKEEVRQMKEVLEKKLGVKIQAI